MTRRDSMDLLATSLMIGFSGLLGLNQALVKLVNAGLAPLFQAGLRSVFAALVVIAWMVLRRKSFTVSDGIVWLGLANGALFGLEFAFLFTALDYSSVARVSLLFYTMPFFVAVGAHFLVPGERLTSARISGLLLAFAGVALVVGFDAVPELPRARLWLGDVLSLLAAMSFASITLLTRVSRLSTISPEMNLLYCLIFSAPILLVLAPWMGDLVRDLTPAICAIFAFQVVVIVSLGFIVWMWVLSVYPVGDMASFSLLTPLFGVYFGWLLFDEALSSFFVAGLVLVCSGLLLINRRRAD